MEASAAEACCRTLKGQGIACPSLNAYGGSAGKGFVRALVHRDASGGHRILFHIEGLFGKIRLVY